MLSSEDEESDDMDEEIPSSPTDEFSVPDMANVGWMDVDEEFKEWIGSDEDEEDEDADEESENESMASASTVKSTSSQKRAIKRSRSSTPGVPQEINGDSPMDEETEKSRANKRQRTLSDRLAIAGEGGEAAVTEDILNAPNDTQEGVDIETHEEIGDDDEFDDDDDSLAAEFEREFLAESEDDEEEVEEAEEEAPVKEVTPSKEEFDDLFGPSDDGGGDDEADEKVDS